MSASIPNSFQMVCVRILGQKSQNNFGTFHISKFIEDTKAACALKFCTRMFEVICYKSLATCPHNTKRFQMVPVRRLVVQQIGTTKKFIFYSAQHATGTIWATVYRLTELDEHCKLLFLTDLLYATLWILEAEMCKISRKLNRGYSAILILRIRWVLTQCSSMSFVNMFLMAGWSRP